MEQTMSRITSSVLIASAMLGSSAYAAVDSDAAIIHLRESCLVNGAAIDNCFTDLPTLNSWVWNTRSPSPSYDSPLRVDIGPGTFTGSFTCDNAAAIPPELAKTLGITPNGWVTLQGSGVENTTIENASSPVSTTFCYNLVFNDITFKNTGTLFGIKNLGGTTVWNNVNLEGMGYTWFDSPNPCNAGGKHYWFNSRIVAKTTAAGSTKGYYTACDESWFFGSEISALGTSGLSQPIQAVQNGKVHVYGGVIRALPAGDVGARAVEASGSAEVHIHGTGIDVIGTGSNNITALDISGGGLIHANESSYVLKTGVGGTITRISNSGGTVSAPFQWAQGGTPPAVNTETGADTMVLTGTADGHPHIAVSDNTCPGKWFDTTTNSCL